GFAGAGPSGIAYAHEYVWVANGLDNTVSQFKPDTFTEGRLTEPISVGKRPVALAAGAGALWTANAGDGTVTRVDFSRSVATIEVGGEPSAIAADDDGVWVGDGEGNVTRIDPDTRRVVK